MPRTPRIEFPGAVYHVMARGDRREPIVFSDDDRATFVRTLAQACQRTGWEVFAWALLDNHYHVAMRTPEANLVEGMRWFQTAFSRRINVKNRLWGHLFGGRYKAVLVESDSKTTSSRRSDYLMTLMDYIHLNPVRAGLIDTSKESLLDYEWCSLAQGYGKSPARRASWMAIEEGLEIFGEPDSTSGRKRFVKRLEDRAVEEKREDAGLMHPEEQSLQSTLRRGWYWGSEDFRELILNQWGEGISGKADRELRSSEFCRRHDENGAEKIIRDGEKHFSASLEEMAKGGRGDLRRVAVAWALARNTSLRQNVIAERSGLKSAANVSQRIKRFEEMEEEKLTRGERKWREKYSRFDC